MASDTFPFTIHSPRVNNPRYRNEITRAFRNYVITQIETFLSIVFTIPSARKKQTLQHLRNSETHAKFLGSTKEESRSPYHKCHYPATVLSCCICTYTAHGILIVYYSNDYLDECITLQLVVDREGDEVGERNARICRGCFATSAKET